MDLVSFISDLPEDLKGDMNRVVLSYLKTTTTNKENKKELFNLIDKYKLINYDIKDTYARTRLISPIIDLKLLFKNDVIDIHFVKEKIDYLIESELNEYYFNASSTKYLNLENIFDQLIEHDLLLDYLGDWSKEYLKLDLQYKKSVINKQIQHPVFSDGIKIMELCNKDPSQFNLMIGYWKRASKYLLHTNIENQIGKDKEYDEKVFSDIKKFPNDNLDECMSMQQNYLYILIGKFFIDHPEEYIKTNGLFPPPFIFIKRINKDNNLHLNEIISLFEEIHLDYIVSHQKNHDYDEFVLYDMLNSKQRIHNEQSMNYLLEFLEKDYDHEKLFKINNRYGFKSFEDYVKSACKNNGLILENILIEVRKNKLTKELKNKNETEFVKKMKI